MIMHPASLGFLSDVCMWHWLRGWWKVHGSEASAFTLFHQRESAEQPSSAVPEISLSEITRRFNYHGGPDCPPRQGTKGYRQMSIDIPEPHPYRSPGRWFLWVLWRSSHLCRSSGYRSRHRAASGGNTSSWRTEAKFRNGIWNKKQ